MGLSIGHLLILLLVVLVLFGSRLPKVMGDLGKGVRNMRDELNRDEPGKQTVLPPEQATLRPEDKDLKS